MGGWWVAACLFFRKWEFVQMPRDNFLDQAMFTYVWSNWFYFLRTCQLETMVFESLSEDSEEVNSSSMDYQVLRTHPICVWLTWCQLVFLDGLGMIGTIGTNQSVSLQTLSWPSLGSTHLGIWQCANLIISILVFSLKEVWGIKEIVKMKQKMMILQHHQDSNCSP